MKKDIIFFTIVTLLVGWSFFAFNYDLTSITGRSLFDGWATSLSLSLSITIAASNDAHASTGVPASGNVTFSNLTVSNNITKITGLSEGLEVIINIYSSTLPISWDEPSPASTVVSSSIRYIELNVSNQSLGSYTIFFNLTSAEMGNIAASSVRLFVFNDTWKTLTTTVVDGTTDPRQFSAVTTHFSKFLIGGAVSSSGSGSVSGGSGSAMNPYSSKESKIEDKSEGKSEDAKLPVNPETLIGGVEEVKIDEKEKEGVKNSYKLDYGIGILLVLSLVILVGLFAIRKPYSIEHVKRSNFIKNVNPMVLLFASIILFTFSASHTGAVIGVVSGNLGISLVLGVVFLIEAFILFHIKK